MPGDSMKNEWIVALLTCAALAGCREPDSPLGSGSLYVSSDPQGGRILVDGEDTGLVTPDTVHNLISRRDIRVELDVDGVTYGFHAEALVTRDEVLTIHGPLMAVCSDVGSTSCNRLLDYHTAADLRFSTSATGALLSGGSTNDGVVAPATSGDRYSSSGMPVFGALVSGVPVATHVYDQDYATGRPALTRSQAGGVLRLEQRMWILPPPVHQATVTVRGIEVRERVIASDAHPGILLIELQYRNITDDELYQTADAGVPSAGIAYQSAYLGYALDPDIGDAGDDQSSYDPDLDAVYTYDAAFIEGNFSASTAPQLVGLRVLRAPPGTAVVLNTWEGGLGRDWGAGTQSQQNGYGVLSGAPVFSPDYPGTEIGWVPSTPHDTRIVATAGPLNLAPGDSATIVIAVALAPPGAGTYTSGQEVAPGDPTDTGRPLHALAATLRQRLAEAELLLPLLP